MRASRDTVVVMPAPLDPTAREADAYALGRERDPLLPSTVVAVDLLDLHPGRAVRTEGMERATRPDDGAGPSGRGLAP